ncbi:MAG: hypothetical protein ACREPJ_02205 [Rhodanobacteraceae bacterium]
MAVDEFPEELVDACIADAAVFRNQALPVPHDGLGLRKSPVDGRLAQAADQYGDDGTLLAHADSLRKC